MRALATSDAVGLASTEPNAVAHCGLRCNGTILLICASGMLAGKGWNG